MSLASIRPVGPVQPGRPVVVTTTESDALHLVAAAGQAVNVATTEGPWAPPDPKIAAILDRATPQFVLTRRDDAGGRIADALDDDADGDTLELLLPDGCPTVADLRARGVVAPGQERVPPRGRAVARPANPPIARETSP